ncbi:hypothetical protein RN001_013729 [Aquatica leii]|uniref:Uncharacterized protein n=1 Tax=Aquatica leii TaxID=1421715 RepID=A0AAN7PR00_9COLE|nr:hypothetical protein RN001_013729 [Aquatica leii]
MNEDTYLELLALVSPLIKKSDTQMRSAITPHKKLTTTLRFLATGRSYEDLKFTTIISLLALGCIRPETCLSLYAVLKTDYLKLYLNIYSYIFHTEGWGRDSGGGLGAHACG